MKRLTLGLLIAALVSDSSPRVVTEEYTKGQNSSVATSSRTGPFDAAMMAGKAAEAKADYTAAAASFQKAIELNPTSHDAHEKFIETSFDGFQEIWRGSSNDDTDDATQKEKLRQEWERFLNELTNIYDKWIQEHPRVGMVYWGKGMIFQHGDQPETAERVFERAIEIDPNCGPAYANLASNAAMRGDVLKERQYLQKAMDVDRSLDVYAVLYAKTYELEDPSRYRRELENIAARNPGEEVGMDALYSIARSATTSQEQVAPLERIRTEYLHKKTTKSNMLPSLSMPMQELFSLYAKSDSAKALSFAEEVHEVMPKDKDWNAIIEYQKAFIKAKDSLEKHDPKALSLLEKPLLKPVGSYDHYSSIDRTPWRLAEAEALARTGDAAKAYKVLMEELLPSPNSDLHAAAVEYGAVLGKAPQRVDEEISELREFHAQKLKPLELVRLGSTQKVQLSDFYAKAVLVDFWYPG